ncbi:uncharacterized protein AB9W97_009667 isoform 3-T3 [Spinachia spinachia]
MPNAGASVQRMSPVDDVQAFVETFEVTAEACDWPEGTTRLLLLLTGEAQLAAVGLPPAVRRVYADVKRGILGLSAEDHRRRCREARMGPGDRPFAFARSLTDAANRWLQPEGEGGAAAVLEKVVLEQLLQSLPPPGG